MLKKKISINFKLLRLLKITNKNPKILKTKNMELHKILTLIIIILVLCKMLFGHPYYR